MSVLDRSELEASPLADLHAIADQLGLDGFRRLRKADLIDAILGEPAKDGNGSGAREDSADGGADADRSGDGDGESERGSAGPPRGNGAATGARKRRTPRLRRGTRSSSEEGESEGEASTRDESSSSESSSSPASSTSSSSRRGRGAGAREGGGGARAAAQPNGRSGRSSKPDGNDDGAADGARSAEGVVELLGNGSAFLRVDPPEPSDDDVYISAAQVRRCELVSGDRVTGPVRTPRRSERYPSLVRVDTINGASADSVSEGAHYEDLPVAYPSQRLALNAGDPTLDAIEWLTPLGRGSRATIVGPSRAGKTETLKRLLGALKDSGLEVTVVLAGARPEEIAEWREGGESSTAPVAALSFAASADAQGQAVERAIEAAKRVAARGADVLVLIDGLDGMHPPAARKALAAARNLRDGGSLTVIATAARPLGGETTVIALDPTLADSGLPLLDLAASGTLKPELLVGEDGAKAIAKARAEARN
jgi:transcription termination factor Rho